MTVQRFHSPPMQEGDPHAPANTAGLRHITFAVDDIKRMDAAGLEPATSRETQAHPARVM